MWVWTVYLAKIGRFRGLGRPPQRKTCLSRQETILGFGQGRPPQSKIALSRRDRTILGFGQASTEENVPISPSRQDRTILEFGQATKENGLISPR